MTQRRSTRDDRGAAMAEYALLVVLIALAALVGIQTFGTTVLGLFNDANLPF